ncbi:hypothetical protein EDD85DRAFT_773483 [Armillaria nabsnona]|nr:hypothetical protein EDD85DRAFT_773483 [Armillaria nabsnona]
MTYKSFTDNGSGPSTSSHQPSFRSGAPSSDAIVCAICLGIHGNLKFCRSTTLWNGGAARCLRTANGSMVNKAGDPICLNWNRPIGCKRSHPSHHECSGCRSSTHGAFHCAYAQKK